MGFKEMALPVVNHPLYPPDISKLAISQAFSHRPCRSGHVPYSYSRSYLLTIVPVRIVPVRKVYLTLR